MAFQTRTQIHEWPSRLWNLEIRLFTIGNYRITFLTYSLKNMLHTLFRNITIPLWPVSRNVTKGIGLKVALIFLTCGLTIFPTIPSFADGLSLRSVSVRGAFDIPDINILEFDFDNAKNEFEHFNQYDIVVVIDLPWGWKLPYLYCGASGDEGCPSSLESGWEVRFLANGSAGVMTGGGSTGFITTFGPGLALRKPSWRVGIDIGGGWALLSDHTYGVQDIGGALQFIGHLGLTVDIGWDLIFGARFHHMSDAGIYGEGKRGVDLYMLSLGYNFNIPLFK